MFIDDASGVHGNERHVSLFDNFIQVQLLALAGDVQDLRLSRDHVNALNLYDVPQVVIRPV